MKTLYLGLRPKTGAFHYPVIRTQIIGEIEPAIKLWHRFTHIIFTSQTTVDYWSGPWDKELIAIGPATARALPKEALVPKEATQEGIAELLGNIRGYFFYPRSKLARPFLVEFLKEKRIPFLALDLYETVFQKLEPVPNLEEFDEIVFTSPSTVEGFLRIYSSIPQGIKISAIGPVTKLALSKSGIVAFT